MTTESKRELRRHAAYAPSTTPPTNESTWAIVTSTTVHQNACAMTSVTGNG